MFILLRNFFSQDEILLDISNFVAHPEGRNKGKSFIYIHKFVIKFLTVFEEGGEIKINEPIFRRDDVINRLISVLKKLQLQFNDQEIIAQKETIIKYLQESIDNVDFQFDNEPRIIRCYTQKNELR